MTSKEYKKLADRIGEAYEKLLIAMLRRNGMYHLHSKDKDVRILTKFILGDKK